MSESSQSTDVMAGMVGKWKLESRDPNFGSFLACRQVGALSRHTLLLKIPAACTTKGMSLCVIPDHVETFGSIISPILKLFPLIGKSPDLAPLYS